MSYFKTNQLLSIILILFSSSSIGQISLCNEEYQHPIDMKAKEIADSLQKIGIDTLLIYRNWYGMNGFNGNGKVLWEQHGTLHQYYISFKNDINDYGIKSIVHSTMPDKVFIYYFDHKIDTVQSNPTAKREGPDHDSNYYVYVRITKAIYCFNVNGQAVKDDSLHPRSQLIFRLLVNTKNNYR